MIAVVVPTIRPASLETFLHSWASLFSQHKIELVIVWDGDHPRVEHKGKLYAEGNIMGKYTDVLFCKNDGIRNMGFAFVAKNLPEVETIITLDDDVSPIGDPIWDHVVALERRVPISWISTASEYMRGFPYGVRDEAEVVLSHGVWENVKDYDAPTQLVRGNPDTTFYRGPIPKGVYYPHCAMNFAFKRKILPYVYQAPMGPKVGLDRFADIWMGIMCKRELDLLGYAVVTGYSMVHHARASNVFTNLQKEAKGIELNEKFWKMDEENPYFKLYRDKYNRWKEFIHGVL